MIRKVSVASLRSRHASAIKGSISVTPAKMAPGVESSSSAILSRLVSATQQRAPPIIGTPGPALTSSVQAREVNAAIYIGQPMMPTHAPHESGVPTQGPLKAMAPIQAPRSLGRLGTLRMKKSLFMKGSHAQAIEATDGMPPLRSSSNGLRPRSNDGERKPSSGSENQTPKAGPSKWADFRKDIMDGFGEFFR